MINIIIGGCGAGVCWIIVQAFLVWSEERKLRKQKVKAKPVLPAEVEWLLSLD
jgi:hypothetical protein